MTAPFDGKRVLLGVTGSIAAYKAADLASKLAQAGAQVNVLMTPAAARFVTPLTFRAVTQRPVLTDAFDLASEAAIQHVELATGADLFIVAPATANALFKLAHGQADDPVSLTALACPAPMLVAPAMDADMWEHPAVQANAAILRERGAEFAGPEQGRLASGLYGRGRLAETAQIIGLAGRILGRGGDLAGKTIVVSAGGTQEPIDPVRVVTNRSSGKMGYALAEAARDRGAEVVLVTAPTALEAPAGVRVVRVETSEQMRAAVHEEAADADALVMAAAVADYRPSDPSERKIKRDRSASLTIEMERTEDIIAEAPPVPARVAFAAESDDLLANARAKLRSKGVHLVVANDVTLDGSGFGADANKAWLVDEHGDEELPLLPKYDVATAILDRVASLLASVPSRPAGGGC